MTLQEFINQTDFNLDTIWVQKYGASREIEDHTDAAKWSKDFLEWPVEVYKKHEKQQRGKNIVVLRFVGDKSND